MKFALALLGLALSTVSARADFNVMRSWRVSHLQCWSATKTPPPFGPSSTVRISYLSQDSGRQIIQISGAKGISQIPLTRLPRTAREVFDWNDLFENFNYSYSDPSTSRSMSFSLNPAYSHQARIVWSESIYDSTHPYEAKLKSGVDCIYELVRLND